MQIKLPVKNNILRLSTTFKNEINYLKKTIVYKNKYSLKKFKTNFFIFKLINKIIKNKFTPKKL